MNHLVVAVAQSRSALFTSTATSSSSPEQKQVHAPKRTALRTVNAIDEKSPYHKIPILPKPAAPIFITPTNPKTLPLPSPSPSPSPSASTTDKQTLAGPTPPEAQTNKPTPTSTSQSRASVDKIVLNNITDSISVLKPPLPQASSSLPYEATLDKIAPAASSSEPLCYKASSAAATQHGSQHIPSEKNNNHNNDEHTSSPRKTTMTTFTTNMSNPISSNQQISSSSSSASLTSSSSSASSASSISSASPVSAPSASASSTKEEVSKSYIHSPSAAGTSSTPGRKPSKAARLRKSVVDPWRQKYDELKAKSTETQNKIKYLPEDYVIQTVKNYFPITSNEDTQIFIRLRKLFQLATLKPKTPTTDQCEWIRDMEDYLIQATQDITDIEYATEIERDKCNGWTVHFGNDNISPSSSSLLKKRRLSTNNTDDDSDDSTDRNIGMDQTNKKMPKKARQSSDVGDVTATLQECTVVANKLNKKFAQLKNKTSNYTFTDFWTQIGVKFQTNDAEYARARRLMNLELQPGVQLFYKANKELILAFLNDQNVTTPTSQRHLSSSNNHGDSRAATTASVTTTTKQSEDHDPTMNIINQFHSRIQSARKGICVKEKEIEENMTKLEQLTQQLIRSKQELGELREIGSKLDSKWEKVQRTLSELMMDRTID